MQFIKTLTDAEAYQSLRKTSLTVGGSLCTVGGFIADVLQPVAPFANYLFLLSLACLAVIGVLFVRGNKNLLGALAISALACGVFGLISLVQTGDTAQDNGIIASTVPAVASLQESLGIIDRKLDALKDDTESIKASTARLEQTTESMMASLQAMRDDIGRGGLIANPQSPEAHYHNARVHELGGNYSAARRSYLAYFRSDLPILDPHLRFIEFLKVQEGTAGARETYNAVTAGSDGAMPTYARLLLRPPAQRIAGLRQYLQDNPDFAPAAYHLSLEYSELRLGSQTLADQRQELAYLQAFQSIDAAGGLLRYMVDQQLVAQWRADAEARLLALSASDGALQNPVTLSWMPHNTGWNGSLQIGEPVQDIQWNIKGQSRPTSTGSSGYTDPATGQPAARMFFSLPKNQQQAVIEIRYTDRSGNQQGPFEFTFEPQRQSEDAGRRTLEMTPTAWLAFRDYDGNTLLYFTHLMTYRGAIESIRYGLDRDTPDQSFRFPPWNKPGIAPLDGSTPMFIKVGRSTRYATVQLTYRNGEKSPIVRIDRG
ncbi:MAG: hypothetical protein NXI15_03080 [Gammaproteobacteria bacterium]|nr:hypothetical protein [Gammaproteobacteria bacterium]